MQLRQGRVQWISKDYHQISHIGGEMIVVTILLDTSVFKLLRLPSHFLIRKFMKRLEEKYQSLRIIGFILLYPVKVNLCLLSGLVKV